MTTVTLHTEVAVRIAPLKMSMEETLHKCRRTVHTGHGQGRDARRIGSETRL